MNFLSKLCEMYILRAFSRITTHTMEIFGGDKGLGGCHVQKLFFPKYFFLGLKEFGEITLAYLQQSCLATYSPKTYLIFFWASNPIHECRGTDPFATFLGKCLLILFDQVTFLAPKVSFLGKCHRPSWISNIEATRDDFAIVVFTTKGPQKTRSLCYKSPLFLKICQFFLKKNLSVFTQKNFSFFQDVPKKMDKKAP